MSKIELIANSYNHKTTNDINNFFVMYKFLERMKGLFPEANWTDCLSTGQLKSKLWVIDELMNIDKDLGTIFVLGGWYGTLSNFILESELKFDKIRSFDIDIESTEIANTFNNSFVIDCWKFKASTYDVLKMSYPLAYITLRKDKSEVQLEEMPNTIINTSCEHMSSDWFNKVPNDTLVILQSNDFLDGNGHMNCVEDIEDMKIKYNLSTILYEGELQLEGYTRYMLIGIK